MIKVNGVEISPEKFPDGTYKLKLQRFGEDHFCVTWLYDGEHELPTLIYIASHLRNYGCREMILYMPYIPNARMDRVKDKSEVFTLKYFADIINGLFFDKVFVLDPHSNVATALIDRVYIVQPKEYIKRAIRDTMQNDLMMVYPDEGAMKRYSGMIRAPYLFGIKKRDWETGNIEGLSIVGNKPDDMKSALICDDICSRGGTFYYTAKALQTMGFENIYLYVTHCENTILSGDLIDSGLLKGIFTTSSIFRKEHPLITTYSMEDYIYGD